MKKFLFTLFILGVTTSGIQAQQPSRQKWSGNIVTTENEKSLSGVSASVIASDGSVYTSGRFDTPISFGSSYQENVATSAFIAKYSAAGDPQWMAALAGAALISDITTDDEGNVYAVGSLADEVKVTSADGASETVKGVDGVTRMTTGFLVKFDQSGNLRKVRTFLPADHPDGAATGVYFPGPGQVNFVPERVRVAGDKVYLSANYMGAVTIDDVRLKGYLAGFEDVFYVDAPNYSLVSFNASDLSNAALVATLRHKDDKTEVQLAGESLSFAVSGDKVYLGFTAAGDTKLVTPTGEKSYSFKSDGAGNNEHGFVFASLQGGKISDKVYNIADADDKSPHAFVSEMALSGDKLFVAGTFNQDFPFDNSVKPQGTCDVFAAALSTSDFTAIWATPSNYKEGDEQKISERLTGMAILSGDQVLLSTYVDDGKDGIPTEGRNLLFANDGKMRVVNTDFYSSICSDGNNVFTFTPKDKQYNCALFDAKEIAAVEHVAVQGSKIVREGDTFYFGASLKATVYAPNGARVLSKEQVNSLSVASLPAGVYLLQAGDETLKFTK